MLLFRSFPAFLRYHHRHHPLLYQCLTSSGFKLNLTCPWVCPDKFRPIDQTFLPIPVDNVQCLFFGCSSTLASGT